MEHCEEKKKKENKTISKDEEGTKPHSENLSDFTLTRTGIKINK